MRQHSLSVLCVIGLAFSAMTAQAETQRLITVSGDAEISVRPDEAIVPMNIQMRHASQKEAEAQVNRVVKRFLEACDDLGIAEKHVKSFQLNIHPEYDYRKQGERSLKGYFVQRSLEVDLKDLEKLGELTEAATHAGINSVSPARLGSSKKKAQTREALAQAAKDAKLNAQAVAESLGAKVGEVIRLSTTHSGFMPQPRLMTKARGMSMSMAEDSGAQSYEVGEIKISAQVTAEFELK